MCINWKVVGGLAVVGVVIYAVAPDLVAGALPLLILAACPLSMLFMMKGMGGMQGGQCSTQGQPAQQAGAVGSYTCSMHPEVRADQPGRCPRCGMALVASESPKPVGVPQSSAEGTLTREEQLAQLRAQLLAVSEQQTALARQVEQLEPAKVPAPPSKALREAEQVARSADGRHQLSAPD